MVQPKDCLEINKKNKRKMLLYNYKNFLFEEADGDKKTIQFLISDKLTKIFKHMNSPVSKAILNEINNPKDISFLDCVTDDKDKTDRITFLPVSKVVPGILSPNHFQLDPQYSAKGRQEMSVGKIVNKLFPNVFKPSDVEQFVNDFKAEIGKFFSSFRLVEGDDIRKYYLVDNYESQQGDINQSCMRYKNAQPFLDIYVKNPDKCKLLILMSDKDPNKIKGRALVWFGVRKPTGRNYMDRIYTIHDADKNLYINYAIENGWLYKTRQVMGDASYIDNGKSVHSSVAIQLEPREYKYYPSLDTLSYYTPGTGRLGSNPGNYIPGNPRYCLNSTTGGTQKLDR